MTSPELGQKVRQLDNDVQAIYEMISTIQSTQMRHTNRFAEIGADIGELKTKVDGLEQRFDGFEKRFDGLEQRFDGLEKRFDGLELKVDTILERLG